MTAAASITPGVHGDAAGPPPRQARALALFFRLAAAAPRLTRLARPAVVAAAWAAAPAVRRATAANAARLCPSADPGAFGRAVLGSFYDFAADVARPATAADLLARCASTTGVDGYRAARAAGRGAVLVTAHLGSFEVGLAALVADEPPDTPVHVVFKRDAVPAFDRLRRRLRDVLGVVEAPVDEGPAVWLRLREVLLANGIVAIQGDRCLPGQRGQRVPVSGGHLRLPVGPFQLAMSADAPVIPVFSTRRPDGRIDLRLGEPFAVTDVAVAALRYARTLAAELEARPAQWLVLHRAFTEDAADPCPGPRSSSPPPPP